MSKILFPEREVNSRKKILKIINSPEMGKVVNNIKEKKEVVSQFRIYGKGGITKDEARKILGKFHYNKSDSLNGNETAALAKAMGIGGIHKYKKPEQSFSKKVLEERREKRIIDDTNISSKTSSTEIKAKGFNKMNTLR